ncbi:RidA family protein [Oceanibacterium hippocampi]|uniref:Enamine/imine deaminase n=1 Tax=Oceanibacterium hippocampi TaxID=745714 RepID=A0A1Y5TZJ3_9PROT|nr:RidA family protein [Oceanibacterium hippocampi]SLN72202.1 Enamine/imine deaminase [Oceanibacterium hippocampi]
MPIAGARQEIRLDDLNPPISHYTDAVRFGNLLFISGIAPLDADLNVVGEDDVVAQARHVFEVIGKILERAGASYENVLKVTVYLTDVDDRTKINPIRKEFFGKTLPASTLIGVKELAIPGMKVEVEAVVGIA